MNLTVAELARQLGGDVAGDANATLTGFASADAAKAGEVTFAENEKFLAAAEAGAAVAVIVPKTFSSTKKTLIRVENTRVAFAKAVAVFFPEPALAPGIHATVVVAKSAQIDPSAHIGPHCVIGERVKIGANTILLARNFVGDDSSIASDTRIFPNVTLYPRTQVGARVRIHAGTVIGADGFGYVQDGATHLKVPQIGHVIIEDDVEIGANACIDRGALGATKIGRGTKIDNLVQVAHNVQTGEHCLLISQSGISGSTKLGNHVILAGQAGLAGHLKVGDGAQVGAQAGVMQDIGPGEKVLGAPGQDPRDFMRQAAALRRLPDLLKKVAALERKLNGE
jgi:UDP-3-O-[3-hydroxymyristoyl] glucosamine N-acyltransferase